MSGIAPYWQSDDGALTVYCARYEDVLAAAGLVPVREVKLIHDDPPYGVNERTARKSNGRGAKPVAGRWAVEGHDFPAIVGDDRPFDPSRLVALERRAVIWGGHLCQPALPPSPSLIIWDKREDQPSDDNGDGEIAWSNLGGPMRIFRHWWRGALRKTEKIEGHLHPTQKPIALCSWVYQRAKLKRGDLVFVPHMGSGPDLPACAAMGLRLIACDVEEWCCRTAVARMKAAPHPEPVAALGPLFAPRPT